MSHHGKMGQHDITWLIKSSGRILGPFTKPQAVDLLRTREVSMLDEISSPLRRWQTIQYHEDFREIINKMRKVNLSDKTEATWTPGGATGNLTQTMTDALNSDLTDEMTDDLGFTNTAKEIVVHQVEEQVHVAPVLSGRFHTQSSQATAIQRQVEKTTRGLWVVTALVLLAVALFILQRKMSHGSLDMRPSASNIKQNILASLHTGQNVEALRDLKSLYPDPNLSGDMAIYFGALLVQVEGQTVVGRRLLNSVIASHRPDLKQAYTSLGIADLIDGQMDSAHENFNRALGIDSSYIPALVNDAVLALRKGSYAMAKALAFKALQISPNSGESLLILAEAQLYLYKGNGRLGEINQVNRMIKNFRIKQWDFASELGFYSLYFDFLSQDRMLDDKIRAYLDQDPNLTNDHRHSLFIYKGRGQWKVLARFCEQMVEKLGDAPRVTAFLASCYSHEASWEQARRNIEKAVQQSPKDALIQSWFSHILKESGDGDQASVVLSRAAELNRSGEFTLPILLQARFCADSHVIDCALSSWQQIYERDLDNLPAVSGLAWVNAEKGFHGEAFKMLEKGLKISPEYIPLLKLRNKAEKEGWYALQK